MPLRKSSPSTSSRAMTLMDRSSRHPRCRTACCMFAQRQAFSRLLNGSFFSPRSTRHRRLASPRLRRIGIELDEGSLREVTFRADLKKIITQVVKARQEGLAALEKARRDGRAAQPRECSRDDRTRSLADAAAPAAVLAAADRVPTPCHNEPRAAAPDHQCHTLRHATPRRRIAPSHRRGGRRWLVRVAGPLTYPQRSASASFPGRIDRQDRRVMACIADQPARRRLTASGRSSTPA